MTEAQEAHNWRNQGQIYDWAHESHMDAFDQGARSTLNSIRSTAALVLATLSTRELIVIHDESTTAGLVACSLVSIGALYKSIKWGKRAKEQYSSRDNIQSEWA